MDFQFSDEQKLVADSIERWLRDRYAFEQWRKASGSERGFGDGNWREMAELGWLAIGVPEADGGLGGGAVDQMIVMEGVGRGLVLEPYLTSAVLGPALLPAKHPALERIAAGNARLAFAQAEQQARFDVADVTTTAQREGTGWRLTGRKVVVLDGPSADLLVVLARSGGSERDRKGLSLFLVPAEAAGVQRRDYRTIDRRRASDIDFDTVVPAEALLGAENGAWPAVEAALDRVLAALAAEAVGCMKVLHADTLAYLKVRKQFGQELANFQVLQHRMVDMMIALEQAKSLAMAAAIRVDEGDPVQRARACAAAKVQAGRAGRFVGQQAIQLHGGMGMTDELRIGHYYKRLMAIETMFGDADWHQRRFADLSLAA